MMNGFSAQENNLLGERNFHWICGQYFVPAIQFPLKNGLFLETFPVSTREQGVESQKLNQGFGDPYPCHPVII